MHFIGKLQNQYEHLWKKIIKPTRAHYSEDNLGPSAFNLQGKEVQRKDFTLTSMRNLNFEGSIWIPSSQKIYNCVIYLHRSQGNRIECMEYLGYLLKHGIAVCGFDLCGCGNAEGQFITMGYYEQQDLKVVVQHLLVNFAVNQLSLWGRSIGAVTCLLYLGKNVDVKSVILDSPYKHLKNYIQSALKKTSNIPSLVMGGAVKVVSSTIEQKLGFDLSNVNPLKYNAPGLHIPVLFIAPIEDESIYQSCKKLFEAYAGDQKEIMAVKQKQNDSRTQECVLKCVSFIRKYFNQHSSEKIKEKESNQFNFFESYGEKSNQRSFEQKKQSLIQYNQESHSNQQEQKSVKRKKDFSISGLFSMFSKKETNIPPKKQCPSLQDEYNQLRKNLHEKSQNKNGESSNEETKANRHQRVMCEEKNKQEMRNWVYCKI